MMKTNIQKTLVVLFQLTIFSVYIYLRTGNAKIIHEPRSFGDTPEYMHIASLPILSVEFWSEGKPPITSAFWKMVDSKPDNIFTLQFIFSVLSWGVLAFTASNIIQSYFTRLITFFTILAFSLSEYIIMWDPFLGSESIAISITALFLTCALWLLSGWKPIKAILLVCTVFLMAFTKDASAYFLVLMAIMIVPLFWATSFRKQAILISLLVIAICLLSSTLAVKGSRRYRVFFTTTAFRIFPSPKYTEYFRVHGMPIDDKLVERSKNLRQGHRYEVLYALEADPEFTKWASQYGWEEYKRFLWFYKTDTLQGVFLETPNESFSPDVYYLTATGYRPIITDQRIKEILYPMNFAIVYFFAANLIAAALCIYAYQQRKSHWLIPLSTILLTYPQAVLVWSADALDIARHSIVFNVFFRFSVLLLLLFVIENLAQWIKRKLQHSLAPSSAL